MKSGWLWAPRLVGNRGTERRPADVEEENPARLTFK